MMNFRLIGAAALSLMLATPAMAMHHGYHHHFGHKELPVQDALRFGYGSAYRAYGFYLGNVYHNDHLDLAPTTPFN